MQEKRHVRHAKARKLIKISDANINERIAAVYERINKMLNQIKQNEIKFSNIVSKWERKDIIDTFVPLIYLDNENRVQCRQEEPFEEIFVSRPVPEKHKPENKTPSEGERMRRLVPAV